MKRTIVACICLLAILASCQKANTDGNGLTTPVGDWSRLSGGVINHLIFKNDQTYQIGNEDAVTGAFTATVNGTYTNTTYQFTLTTAAGANACDTIKGNYGYTIISDTLTLTTISDGCLSGGANRSTYMEGKWGK